MSKYKLFVQTINAQDGNKIDFVGSGDFKYLLTMVQSLHGEGWYWEAKSKSVILGEYKRPAVEGYPRVLDSLTTIVVPNLDIHQFLELTSILEIDILDEDAHDLF